MANEDVYVALVRLEGKVDNLATKFDGKVSEIIQRIDAGDRELQQLVRFQNDAIDRHEHELIGLGERIASLKRSTDERFEEFAALKNRMIGVAIGAGVGTGGLVGLATRLLTG